MSTYTQQNGLAERKQWHITNHGLTLMFQARFHSFWVEVFFTNFFPVTSFLHQPSFLYGKPHEYSSLRSFGCSCYPAHRDYATNKFDFKSLHYMFLGYNDKFKGYRCIHPLVVCISATMCFFMKTFSIWWCIVTSSSRCYHCNTCGIGIFIGHSTVK